MHFYKPEITFFANHPIGFELKKDYDLVFTQRDLIEFIFRTLQEAIDNNDGKEKAILEMIAIPLYQIVTNKSYQSKITI